jgi:predicted glycoside hydrolase/deacetylase ChbG (UPF0249 family)
VGVHLNLTSGKSLRKNLNYICNKKNYFNRSLFFFFFLIYFSPKRKKILDQIYLELDAQINFLKKKKLTISHLDSHNHVHSNPLIFRIVKKLSIKHNIKNIRSLNEKIIFKNFFLNFKKKIFKLNYLKFIIVRINKFFNNNNNNIIFYGLIESGLINRNYINNIFRDRKNQTFEICVHPSKQTKAIKGVKEIVKKYYNKKDVESFYSVERSNEFSELCKLKLNKKFLSLINFNNVNKSLINFNNVNKTLKNKI